MQSGSLVPVPFSPGRIITHVCAPPALRPGLFTPQAWRALLRSPDQRVFGRPAFSPDEFIEEARRELLSMGTAAAGSGRQALGESVLERVMAIENTEQLPPEVPSPAAGLGMEGWPGGLAA